MTHQDSLYYQDHSRTALWIILASLTVRNGVHSHQNHGQVATGGRGSVPGSSSPSIVYV